jgi:hypothetical protein
MLKKESYSPSSRQEIPFKSVNTVMHRPIARQRLGKHIPMRDNARNKRT